MGEEGHPDVEDATVDVADEYPLMDTPTPKINPQMTAEIGKHGTGLKLASAKGWVAGTTKHNFGPPPAFEDMGNWRKLAPAPQTDHQAQTKEY